jgi:hypothetical protein
MKSNDLLFVYVAAIVIIPVADGGKGFLAMVALIRLFAGVNSHVHKQIASLVERLVAPHASKAWRKRIAHVHHDVRIFTSSPHLPFALTFRVLIFFPGKKVRI